MRLGSRRRLRPCTRLLLLDAWEVDVAGDTTLVVCSFEMGAAFGAPGVAAADRSGVSEGLCVPKKPGISIDTRLDRS